MLRSGVSMNSKLKKFIYSEQVKNNYSLYKNDDSISFELDISEEYKPAFQKIFRLPYFLIPICKDKIKIDENYKFFFEKNIFIKNNGKIFYPFFVHPTSERIFCKWIGKKYEYVNAENSIFEATPTSSYRSLVVKNIYTEEYFMAKVSIFGNVANGARQIDWTSAEGQYFFSKCTNNIIGKVSDFAIIKDIGAFGITGDYVIQFSRKYNITYGPNKIQSFGNVIRCLDDIFYDKTDTIICSIASITSVVDKNDCWFKKIYLASGKKFEDFFLNDFIMVIFEKFFEIFSTYGISLECHCQNTLIEVTENWKFTGKIIYRDFDITSLDRARFPFIFPREWNEYCKNRLDRTSLYSNLSAREETGKNFFFQLIGSIVQACLLCAEEINIVNSEQAKNIYNKIYLLFIEKIHEAIPLDKPVLKTTKAWPFSKKVYSDIDISEIPFPLIKIKSFEKELYEKLLINSPEFKVTDYYKTEDENYILGFSRNIYTQLFMRNV